ncbi:MAG: hypothetical protein WC648_04770 [Candidatus Paceibacterota bacterium]
MTKDSRIIAAFGSEIEASTYQGIESTQMEYAEYATLRIRNVKSIAIDDETGALEVLEEFVDHVHKYTNTDATWPSRRFCECGDYIDATDTVDVCAECGHEVRLVDNELQGAMPGEKRWVHAGSGTACQENGCRCNTPKPVASILNS